MSRKKTDFRALQHRRAIAMQRTELREDQKRVDPITEADLEAAKKSGRFIRIESTAKKRWWD